MEKDNFKKGEVIIYQTSKKEVKLDVRLEEETVWLTQKQMAILFSKGIPTINEHINNIYKEGELNRLSTIRKFRIVQVEGDRRITRNIDFYNLDVIISVGYRVKSQRGTQFRIWATKVLKEHLIKGYTINEKRLAETQGKFQELQTAISFLQDKSQKELLTGQSQEILNLLSSYSKTLKVLDEYDKGKLKDAKGKRATYVLTYKDCITIIISIKKKLIAKKESSDLFGIERQHAFESIVKNIYQTFGGKELYPTIEDKASHLLYLVIKDHPFSDGNKRIASFLFVYFLDKSKYLYKKSGERKINDNALIALALLIAESDPKEKEVMVRIVKNLLIE